MTTPITISAIRTYNTCRRKYLIQYLKGYEPIKKADALDFGSQVHEQLKRTLSGETDFRYQENPKLDVTLNGYVARWGRANLRSIIAVEKEFCFELAGHKIVGKIDALVHMAGKVVVIEHKTTSEDISPQSDYWLKTRLDDQVSMYALAVESMSCTFGGCIFDVIKKHKEEPYKATPIEDRKYKKDGTLYANQRAEDESLTAFRDRLAEKAMANPDAYYARQHVTRSREELDTFKEELIDHIEKIKSDKLFPRNPSACFLYNRRCAWHDVCSGCDELTNVSRYKKSEKVNKELEFDLD